MDSNGNDHQDDNEHGSNRPQPGQDPGRPSWPYPVFLFLYVVILLVTPMIGKTPGLLAFFTLIAFCGWSALSKKQYEQMLNNYPELERSDYITNMLMVPVILPLVIFTAGLLFRIFYGN